MFALDAAVELPPSAGAEEFAACGRDRRSFVSPRSMGEEPISYFCDLVDIPAGRIDLWLRL
jgi:hypothetical protein